MPERYVLLDRDGTINVDRHYLSDPDELELLPGVVEGLRLLRRAGWGLIVVTNQSGIARGYFDEARLSHIHNRLREMLAGAGVPLDAVYHCPHGPADNCRCRKPRPGMIEQAAQEIRFEASAAVMIGDKPCDIELGHAVGATTILVRTGYGSLYAAEYEGVAQPDDAAEAPLRPHHIADNLVDAALWIFNRKDVRNSVAVCRRGAAS